MYNNYVDLSNIIGGNNKYPKIDDNDFQIKIKKVYNKYIIKNKQTFKEICFPEKFTYQLPQLFVSEFINPDTPYKSLLLYHKIGAGKTCAAINIAEKWKYIKKIMFICPASLIGNVYNELRSQCANNEYISSKERNELKLLDISTKEYNNIIEKTNERINKYYDILSYNKFVNLSQQNKINLSNYLLIIDEVQNIVSENGIYYKTFLDEIKNAPKNLRVIIMSATPIFDKPIELALTINLLRPHITIPINPTFNETFLKIKYNNGVETYDLKNANKLKKLLSGYVSYYQGAPEFVFPKKIIKIVRCRMSYYQYQCYKIIEHEEGKLNQGDILKLPNNFFIGSRMISNIAFPNKLIKEQGYTGFKGSSLKDNLQNFSIKFYKIINHVKKCKGTCFIYSNFREYGGIQSLIKVLEYNGFKNFKEFGSGKNRFATWSGDEDINYKNNIRDIFNQKQNVNGSFIKLILGSPAIKEGVSLLRVKQVHILEPYWNISRLEQVMGRAVRFCSHKDIPLNEREVKIYIYIAVDPNNKKLTVDRHILNIAFSKDKLIKQFEQVIKDAAIDYHLFQKNNS